MLMYQNSMFDHYYCIGYILTRNCLKKFIFHCMQNDADGRVTRRLFNNAAFRAYTNVTVMSQNNACYSARFT